MDVGVPVDPFVDIDFVLGAVLVDVVDFEIVQALNSCEMNSVGCGVEVANVVDTGVAFVALREAMSVVVEDVGLETSLVLSILAVEHLCSAPMGILYHLLLSHQSTTTLQI